MNNLQTPLNYNNKIKTYQETETPYNIKDYNNKIIKDFDKDVQEDNLTPVSQSLQSSSLYKEPTPLKTEIASIDNIYFEPEFISAEFQTALRLLSKAIKYCDASLSEFRKDNLVSSDNAIIHLQMLLPELFCCRNLSESFGAIINSIQNALSNNRGQPLPENKIIALKEVLNSVRNEPFMRFDKAVELIMAFEDHDFIVEPIGFDSLVELLNE